MQNEHGANVGTNSADQHGPAAQVDLEAGLEEEEAAALGAAHDRDDGRHRMSANTHAMGPVRSTLSGVPEAPGHGLARANAGARVR